MAPSPVSFVNVVMWKYFFIASFHLSMRFQMFYKIDALKNSAKFTEKRLYQALLFQNISICLIFRAILGYITFRKSIEVFSVK